MDESALVALVRTQDPAALQELVRLYGQRLLSSAFLLCGNETNAQDLVQETFLKAIESIHRFQGRSTIYTWLHAILLNLYRREKRSRWRTVSDQELVDVAQEAAEGFEHDTELATESLREGLAGLSPSHREVLVLRFYEGMKLAELAEHLGISVGTAKSRLHYAIGEMQKFVPPEMNLFGGSDTKRTEA